MPKIQKPPFNCNTLDMPLFRWAEAQLAAPLHLAARRLCRAGYAPPTAKAICDANGWGGAA